MGGRRRSGKSQGIRKGKSNRSRQTPAKVAERKAANVEKLRLKISTAESRAQEGLKSRLGLASATVRASSKVTEEVDLHDILPRGEDGERERRRMELAENAYGHLVKDLKDSIFAETTPAAREDRPFGQREDEEEDGAQNKMDLSTHIVEKEKQFDVETSNSNVVSLERQNHAAVIREKEQFDTAIVAKAVTVKLTTICSLPNVGRVSVALSSEEKLKAFEDCLKKDIDGIDEKALGLQPSVHAKWQTMTSTKAVQRGLKKRGRLSGVERAFICAIRGYHDVFLSKYLSEPEEDGIRDIYAAHALSHVLRCRARVARNDSALKKDPNDTGNFKDQGFSRARVLILVPMRNLAYDVVKAIMGLAVGAEEGEKDVSHIANHQRFEEEFSPGLEEDIDDDGFVANDQSAGGYNDPADGIRKPQRKPADHIRTFRGNIDDDFKLGISFTKKTVKLYSDFYLSDIIIASPLGLRRTIAEKASGQNPHSSMAKDREEDTEWKTGLGAGSRKPKQDDADEGYLSSVEMCIIDGADLFSMQNWDTLRTTVCMMNKMPSSTREADFSRLRDWCLDGLMQQFRQTVMISKYRKSEFFALMRQFSNHSGKVQIVEPPSERGSMTNVAVGMRQTFYKVEDVDSPITSPEKRFAHFCKHLLPMIQALVDSQCLLIVPSYFDYVRVRNKLVEVCKDDSSFQFASMCEYSKGSDISRARARLYDRSVSLVVMTERFHFFRRHWIRGANVIAWYGLPENARYYPEILNMIGEAAENGRPIQSMALFDSFDRFRLEGVVGSARCLQMIRKNSRSTYMFL